MSCSAELRMIVLPWARFLFFNKRLLSAAGLTGINPESAKENKKKKKKRIWLVGCFGLKGLLRQYYSLYRAISQREGERKYK